MALFPAPHPGITIILGMAGSGTLLCSQLLGRLGTDMTDAPDPCHATPAGAAERAPIVALHDRAFRQLGCDPLNPHPLPLPPGWWTRPELRAIRDEIAHWVWNRLAAPHPFGINDPRVGPLLPLWREALAPLGLPPRFILCLRDPAALVPSWVRNTGLPPTEAALRWLACHSTLVDALGTDDVTLLPHEAWHTDPAANLARLPHAAGATDPADARVRDLLGGATAPSPPTGAPESPLPPLVHEFHAMLMRCLPHGGFDAITRHTARTFTAAAALFQPLLAEPATPAADLEAAQAEAHQAKADLLALQETERRGRWAAAAALASALAERDHARAALAAPSSAAPPPAARPTPGRVAFSCVLDEAPALSVECELWLNCLLRLHGVPPAHVFIHAPVGCTADLLPKAAALGVNIVPIVPPDPRSPHCNKICQLETFTGGGFDHVVLMDCDTAWVGPMELPRAAADRTAPAMAKLVDRPNPPEPALAALFHAAGLGEPDWVAVGYPPDGGRRTDRNNCNGGLYVLDRAILPGLAPLWRKWALWCLDQGECLGRHVRNADQLGFALALREMRLAVTPLPIEWNYPTHLPAAELPDVPPRILHYHKAVSPEHRLLETGIARPDAAIRALNGQMSEFDRLAPPVRVSAGQ